MSVAGSECVVAALVLFPLEIILLMAVCSQEYSQPVLIADDIIPHGDGLVVSMSTSYAAGCWFTPQPGNIRDNHKNGTTCLPAWHTGVRSLSVWPDCVQGWVVSGTVSALETSPGIKHKRRGISPGSRFQSQNSCYVITHLKFIVEVFIEFC